jgi:hypothetical protein
VVDPYFTANAFLAWEPDEAGPEAATVLEEVYVRTLGLPSGLALRAGRFYIPFGRHNQLHTHEFPFVESPLAVRSITAEESAGDVALELDYAPHVPWYLNITAYGGDGAVEGVFDGESRDLAWGGRLLNLFDLSEATTFELGGSLWDGPLGAGPEEGQEAGVNGAAESLTGGHRRTLVGADTRIKYRDPRQRFGRAFEWQAELFLDYRDEQTGKDPMSLFTFARYRFLRVWWIGAGYSWFSFGEDPAADREKEQEVRGQLAWTASEFSAIRAEFVWHDRAGLDEEGVELADEIAGLLQLNFTIGSHPAHRY